MHTETKPAAELRLHDASPEHRSVMAVLALDAMHRPRAWIFSMLGLLAGLDGGACRRVPS